MFNPTYFKDTVNYENDTSNISNNSGLTLYKNTTDASNVLTVKNAQGYIGFNYLILMHITRVMTVLLYFY